MELEESQSLGASDIIELIRSALSRYWLISIGPALVTVVLVGLVGARLPSYYTVDTQIFLQPQRLESDLIRESKPKELEEKRDALIETILARQSLQKVAQRHKLYPRLESREGSLAVVKKLRKEIKTIPVATSSGSRNNALFRLAFSYSSSEKTYKVLKELTDLFIEESNLVTSTEVKRDVEFFDGQLAEAKHSLEKTESALNTFVEQNIGRLPKNMDSNIKRMELLRTRVESNRLQIATLKEKLVSYQQESKLVSAATSAELVTVDPSNPADAIRQLRGALAQLRMRYSDKHPDVIRTRQRISALKRRLDSSGKNSESSGASFTSSSPEVRNIQRLISDTRIRVNELARENERLESDANELQGVIDSTPAVDQEMMRIQREYEANKTKYEQLKKAKEDADLRAEVVSSQRGAQFRVLEPPVLPERPAGPARKLIVAGGGVLGALVFLGLPLLFFFINPAFKLVSQVESTLGVPVLGVLPPMKTPYAESLKIRLVVISLAFSVLSLLLGGLIIVFLI